MSSADDLNLQGDLSAANVTARAWGNGTPGDVLTRTATGAAWAPGGGGGGVGPGTVDRVAKFATATTVGDSKIIDDGSGVSTIVTGPEVIQDVAEFAITQQASFGLNAASHVVSTDNGGGIPHVLQSASLGAAVAELELLPDDGGGVCEARMRVIGPDCSLNLFSQRGIQVQADTATDAIVNLGANATGGQLASIILEGNTGGSGRSKVSIDADRLDVLVDALIVFTTLAGKRTLVTNLSFATTYGANASATVPLIGAGPFNDVTVSLAMNHISSTLASQISGFSTPTSGNPWPNFPIVHYTNVGTTNIVLLHESALSVATNRLRLVGGVNETIPPGGGWIMTPAPVPSLGGALRWQLLGVNQ
jgi:hypothetical protein